MEREMKYNPKIQVPAKYTATSEIPNTQHNAFPFYKHVNTNTRLLTHQIDLHNPIKPTPSHTQYTCTHMIEDTGERFERKQTFLHNIGKPAINSWISVCWKSFSVASVVFPLMPPRDFVFWSRKPCTVIKTGPRACNVELGAGTLVHHITTRQSTAPTMGVATNFTLGEGPQTQR